MSRPLKVQIVERARALIADEQHWCRGELARDAKGRGICPMSDSAMKRCGLGALLMAAYEITSHHRAAYDLAIRAMRPLHGTTSSKSTTSEVTLRCSDCSIEVIAAG